MTAVVETIMVVFTTVAVRHVRAMEPLVVLLTAPVLQLITDTSQVPPLRVSRCHAVLTTLQVSAQVALAAVQIAYQTIAVIACQTTAITAAQAIAQVALAVVVAVGQATVLVLAVQAVIATALLVVAAAEAADNKNHKNTF
jgi:hypothetical protein